jgi:hypothetical protein
VYTRCHGCDRSLGTNTEIPHLPVGRRLAFDSVKGRLWVICTRCDQWNLVPLEERWEAVEECERVATTAEVRGPGDALGLARTTLGLELLRVEGHRSVDIANWRYGRRLKRRQSLLWWIAGALLFVAVALGVRAWFETGSSFAGMYIFVAMAAWFGYWWRKPPKLWLAVKGKLAGKRVWSWRASEIRFVHGHAHAPPELEIPQGQGVARLTGDEALTFLAALLPRLNGADCASASISRVVKRVDGVERKAQNSRKVTTSGTRGRHRVHRPLRPWELLASDTVPRHLFAVAPEERLALEMAVTEELEHRELASHASEAESDWREEDEIAAIADDLLTPPEVAERLQAERQKRDRGG